MPDHRPDPKLRWYSEPVTRAPIFVVPGDASSSAAVKPMGRTWGMRVSGDVDKLVPHEYCCPVHGRFTLRVKASDVPDEVFCAMSVEPALRDVPNMALVSTPAGPRAIHVCGLTSPWAGAACAIGWEPGTVTG